MTPLIAVQIIIVLALSFAGWRIARRDGHPVWGFAAVFVAGILLTPIAGGLALAWVWHRTGRGVKE